MVLIVYLLIGAIYAVMALRKLPHTTAAEAIAAVIVALLLIVAWLPIALVSICRRESVFR